MEIKLEMIHSLSYNFCVALLADFELVYAHYSVYDGTY